MTATRARFAEVVRSEPVDVGLACLLIGGEVDRDLDVDASLERLDALAAQARRPLGPVPRPADVADALRRVLGEQAGFAGQPEDYEDVRASLLHEVLRRGRGLPILLSVVYAEAARRAGIALSGVGLPGHFVVGHFGADPPVLLDPFSGGAGIEPAVARDLVRPWTAHETALRMLNNLVGSYTRRNDLGRAIAAAELRLELPLERALAEALGAELRALRARLN